MGRKIRQRLENKKFVALDNNAENIKIFGDNQTFAFTVKNNLFVNKNGKTIAVTNDTDENILNGASNVHRNEFGIDTEFSRLQILKVLLFTEWIRQWLQIIRLLTGL
jgi:hypothetical protein